MWSLLHKIKCRSTWNYTLHYILESVLVTKKVDKACVTMYKITSIQIYNSTEHILRFQNKRFLFFFVCFFLPLLLQNMRVSYVTEIKLANYSAVNTDITSVVSRILCKFAV